MFRRRVLPGVALITGAGSGLGRQLARDLAQRGWKIAGLDVQPSGLEELDQEMQTRDHSFAWRVADVEKPAMLTSEVTQLETQLGSIDLLIACAGVARDTPSVGMDVGAISRIVGINLIGVSNTIAAVLPGMLARRRGHIVAVSSLASYWGLPDQMGYCASKAGLNALMQCLWLDVKEHGLDVTTVCPGHIATPQAIGMFNDDELMPVRLAAQEILFAIDRRRRFHAFPRFVALQLRLLRWLPSWLRERLLVSHMKKARSQAQADVMASNNLVPQRLSVAAASMAIDNAKS